MSSPKDVEKDEILKVVDSDSLREDMRTVKENRKKFFVSEGPFSLDDAIHFLSQINTFANHRPKPFHKMKGRHFIF